LIEAIGTIKTLFAQSSCLGPLIRRRSRANMALAQKISVRADLDSRLKRGRHCAMALEGTIHLGSLRCIAESDNYDHSEPYAWTVLFWLDDAVMGSPELVGEFAPPWWSSARAIISRGIEAGQQAQMPEPQRAFTHVFETDSETKSLTIVVVLLEQDDTPDDAVDAAYQVFVPELKQALIDFYFAHNQTAPDPDSDEDMQEIVGAVQPKVEAAAWSELSGWQRARVVARQFNLDDRIGFDAFTWTETPNEPGQRTFTLRFEDNGNNFEIDGRLDFSQIPDPGPCQDEAEAVRNARERVDGITDEIERILVRARLAKSQEERAALIAEARRIEREELRPATVALGAAQYALTRCFTRVSEQGPSRR
jgi:hypothetical protein